MSTKIQIRRDTAAAWTAANPVLASGELALETDTRKRKVGDGATAWTALAYESSSAVILNPNPTASALKGWSDNPSQVAAGNATTAAGTLYLAKIPAPAAVSLSKVSFVVGATAPVGLTSAFAYLIRPDGTVAATSADLAAALNATAASTAFTADMTAAVSVGGASATDFVYAAFGYSTVTTAPTLAAVTGGANGLAAINLGLAVGAYRYAQLAAAFPLGASVVLANQTQASSRQFWFAVS